MVTIPRLAQAVSVKPEIIEEIENGSQMPNPDLLEQLAQFFDVTAEYFESKDDPQPAIKGEPGPPPVPENTESPNVVFEAPQADQGQEAGFASHAGDAIQPVGEATGFADVAPQKPQAAPIPPAEAPPPTVAPVEPVQAAQAAPKPDPGVQVQAVIELLIRNGYITANDLRDTIERIQSIQGNS